MLEQKEKTETLQETKTATNGTPTVANLYKKKKKKKAKNARRNGFKDSGYFT